MALAQASLGYYTDADLVLWADTLAGLEATVVGKAAVEYQKNGPRNQAGKLIKPSAGDIYKIACCIDAAARSPLPTANHQSPRHDAKPKDKPLTDAQRGKLAEALKTFGAVFKPKDSIK